MQKTGIIVLGSVAAMLPALAQAPKRSGSLNPTSPWRAR